MTGETSPKAEKATVVPALSAASVVQSPAGGNPSIDSKADFERIFADVLAEILKVERVDAEQHFFDDLGADSMVMARFCARIRKRSDVPAVSMKDVYAGPTIARLVSVVVPAPTAPEAQQTSDKFISNIERVYAEVLAGILAVENVDTDKHFFDDLGADSMVMARFCARIRKRDDVPKVAMKDVYAAPTVARLAAEVATANWSAETSPSNPPIESLATKEPLTVAEPPIPATNVEVAVCGALQVATSLAYLYVFSLVFTVGYRWVDDAAGYAETFMRSTIVASGGLVLFSLLPILAKWVLVGRWTVRPIRIWSLDYVRFWIVKSLIRSNPLVLLTGTPVYVAYLRALGARIGRNVLIHSTHVPVCTDLLTIGDDAIVRKDAYFNCYRAHAGSIQTGPVSLGKNSFVGEMTVLDIDTSLGDEAQIGHSSALYAGQSIPANERRQGSPAQQQTAFNYRDVPQEGCGMARKVAYSAAVLLPMLLIPSVMLSAMVTLVHLMADRPHFEAAGIRPFLHWELFVDAVLISAILFFGSLAVGLAFVGTIPRILNRALVPGKVYRLYGLQHGAHQLIGRLTNNRFFTYLFGDSSYIVHYLQWIGYNFPKVVQTGSNFGMDLKHDNPFLVTVGSGTVIADGLSVINSDYSSSSFRVSEVTIGKDNFLGNFVAYPAQAKAGDNCLLATKVMVPAEGEVRQGCGLLGSPSFEIPRSVARDRDLELDDDDERARRLAAKDKHNRMTMGLFLAVHWFEAVLMTALAFSIAELYGSLDAPLAALVATVTLLFATVLRVAYYILAERVSTGFQPLRPQQCSIYDPYFWFHERYWKMMTTSAQLSFLDGTPFKGLAWRLNGVNIGNRVFDDGCGMTERTMVTIGDDCTLNMGSIIQPHSQEDGGFKSDRIELGVGCTLGVGAWAHYGVKLGRGAVLAPNAFLMKGEEVPAGDYWGENPAREIASGSVVGSPGSQATQLANAAQ